VKGWRHRIVFTAAVILVSLPGCAHLVVLNDPLTASEHNDLGVAYESRHQLELAEREYRKALRLDPGLTRARVNLGNVAGARGHWSVAERCFRTALRRDPNDRDAMNNLAVALVRQRKRLDEAEAWAARAAQPGIGPDSLYRATLDEVRRAKAERDSGPGRPH